jgi:hypothetical protein
MKQIVRQLKVLLEAMSFGLPVWRGQACVIVVIGGKVWSLA